MSEPDYKRETLQTAEELAGDTVPRSVADRLAEELANCHPWLDYLSRYTLANEEGAIDEQMEDSRAALADYRKAVPS